MQSELKNETFNFFVWWPIKVSFFNSDCIFVFSRLESATNSLSDHLDSSFFAMKLSFPKIATAVIATHVLRCPLSFSRGIVMVY
jgi:hypothetical protein